VKSSNSGRCLKGCSTGVGFVFPIPKGLFSRIRNGAKILKENRIPFYLISTLGKHNYSDDPKLIEFAKEYETTLHLRSAIRTSKVLKHDLHSKELPNLLKPYLDHPNVRNGFLATKKSIPESKWYGCGIKKRISVDYSGTLFPCVMDRKSPLKNIKEYSQESICYDLEAETKKFLNNNKDCKDCDINKQEIRCGGPCRFSNSYENGTTK